MRVCETDEVDPDAMRAQAVAIAWSLLSKLGQQSIQVVMSYVFDAVDAVEGAALAQVRSAPTWQIPRWLAIFLPIPQVLCPFERHWHTDPLDTNYDIRGVWQQFRHQFGL